jgi:hypothetical protein
LPNRWCCHRRKPKLHRRQQRGGTLIY